MVRQEIPLWNCCNRLDQQTGILYIFKAKFLVLHPAVIFVLLASFVSLTLTIYTFRFRRNRGILNFCLLMLCVTVYSFAYALELNATILSDALFWNKMEYFGISFIPAFYLLFVLRYTQTDGWLKNRYIPFFFVIPLITVVMHWTTSRHGLYYRNIHLESLGNLSVLAFDRGFFYWLQFLYLNFAILTGLLLFYTSYREHKGLQKKQFKIILVGSAMPWLIMVLYTAGVGPKGVDLNPFGFMFSGLIIGYGIFFRRLFDVTPVAFTTVFRDMREGVIILDANQRVISFNPALVQYFPFINDQWIGVPVSSFPDVLGPLKKLLGKHSLAEVEFPCELSSGRRFFHAAISPLYDNRTRQQGRVVILFDITARKEAEEKLAENEKRLAQLNATKDRILSIIAHDLRNPFNQVIGFSEVLLAQTGKCSEEKTREILGYIHTTSLKASQLLENLLQWVGAQTGMLSFNPEPVDIQVLLQEYLDAHHGMAAGKNIRLYHSYGEHCTILADKNMLGVIIRNLLSNALKFTASGGEITAGYTVDNDGVTIYVRDTGTGISPDKAERLFTQPFNESTTGTRGEKGSGLGLALCKEFVDLHQGRIWVESVEGKGSTFFFRIPYKLPQH